MPNPTWPLATKRPRLDWNVQRENTCLRTEMTLGPPKLRRRTSAGVRPHEFSIGPLTGAEKATLETWHRAMLLEGSLAFDWVDDYGATVSATFAAPPTFSVVVPGNPITRLWTARISIEVLP